MFGTLGLGGRQQTNNDVCQQTNARRLAVHTHRSPAGALQVSRPISKRALVPATPCSHKFGLRHEGGAAALTDSWAGEGDHRRPAVTLNRPMKTRVFARGLSGDCENPLMPAQFPLNNKKSFMETD